MAAILMLGLGNAGSAAVVVTSGTGNQKVSVKGSYNLPGTYQGSVNGSNSNTIPLPDNQSNTLTFSTADLLPPGVGNASGIANGGGTSKLTISTLAGGLIATGRASASADSVLGVGGGSGSTGTWIDAYFTITNLPATFHVQTSGGSDYANASLSLTKENDISFTPIGGPPTASVNLTNTLLPGDYHLQFSVGAFTPSDFGIGGAGSQISFQLSVVPEVSSIITMGGFLVGGATFIVRRRRRSTRS